MEAAAMAAVLMAVAVDGDDGDGAGGGEGVVTALEGGDPATAKTQTRVSSAGEGE